MQRLNEAMIYRCQPLHHVLQVDHRRSDHHITDLLCCRWVDEEVGKDCADSQTGSEVQLLEVGMFSGRVPIGNEVSRFC